MCFHTVNSIYKNTCVKINKFKVGIKTKKVDETFNNNLKLSLSLTSLNSFWFLYNSPQNKKLHNNIFLFFLSEMGTLRKLEIYILYLLSPNTLLTPLNFLTHMLRKVTDILSRASENSSYPSKQMSQWLNYRYRLWKIFIIVVVICLSTYF